MECNWRCPAHETDGRYRVRSKDGAGRRRVAPSVYMAVFGHNLNIEAFSPQSTLVKDKFSTKNET